MVRAVGLRAGAARGLHRCLPAGERGAGLHGACSARGLRRPHRTCGSPEGPLILVPVAVEHTCKARYMFALPCCAGGRGERPELPVRRNRAPAAELSSAPGRGPRRVSVRVWIRANTSQH